MVLNITKIKWNKSISFILLSIFVCFLDKNPALSFDEKKIGLMANVEPGKIVLRWTQKAWPKGLVGFSLKKRFKNTNKIEEWQKIGVLIPDDSLEKDWSLIDKNLQAQSSLKKNLMEMIEDGKYSKHKKGSFVKRLSQMTEGELLEINNNIQNSYNYALMLGFGYVDRQFTNIGSYEYGLFPVYSGYEDKLPKSLISCDLKSTKIQWLSLVGAYQNGLVKLKWSIKDFWPENAFGFIIMKRTPEHGKQAPGKWIKVNLDPIYPQSNINKNWKNLNIDNNKENSLRLKLKSMLASGKFKSISRDEFLKFALSASIDELKGTNFLIAKGFDYALITGFGCVDRNFSKNDVYEYGIFGVNKNKIMDKMPISKFIVKMYHKEDKSFSVNLNAIKAKKGTLLKWTYNYIDFNNRALIGYNVYRASKDYPKAFEKLNKTPISTVNMEDQMLVWHFIDRIADNTKKYIYAVSPVDAFNNEYAMTKFKYLADPNDFDIYNIVGNLKIIQVKQQNGYNVEITWDFSKEGEKHIQGFIIERMVKASKKPDFISDLLPVDSRVYIDKDKKQESFVYAYQVKILGKQGVIKKSAISYLYYIDRIKLAPPDSFKIEYIDQENTGYVNLTWKPNKNNENKISNYVLFSDISKKGEMVREASISINIYESQYMYRLGERMARDFTFGIAAKSKTGIVGNISYASCYVPLKELPPVKTLHYSKLNKGTRIKLEWMYDSFHELDGFEIIQDCKSNRIISHANKNERVWTSLELNPNTLYKFQIIASSTRLGQSKFNEKLEYFYIQRKKNNKK